MNDRIRDTNSFTEISEQVLSQGAALRFRAHGNSMFPFVRDGDILTVQPAEADTLKRGDVILFKREDQGVTAHRIVRRLVRDDNVILITRGDAALAFQEEIPSERVLGKVITIERGSKRLRPDRGWLRCAALVWIHLRRLRCILAGARKRLVAE